MGMRLTKRALKTKPSATLAITAKAKAMQAEGIDVVGFGAGEPDFDTPENIKECAIKSLKNGFTKYTPVAGIIELKDAIRKKLKEENGLEYSREEIIISCGAKHSLFNIAQTIFEEDDEVIIPAPYWVSYPDQVEFAGAKPVFVDTKEENGFLMDPKDLSKALSSKTKAIILNSPSNPTGCAYNKNQLGAIAEIAVKNDLIVVSDEIYEKLVYDGFQHVSIASLGPEIFKRTIVVNGHSKSFSMTGWRLGYCAGPKEVVAAMSNIQGQSTSNPTSFVQVAGVEALNGPKDAVQRMIQEFKKRRDYIVGRLNSMLGVSCFNPPGSFYVFPNFSKYFGKSFGGQKIKGSLDLTKYLLEQAKVAVVPGVEFGADEFVRLSYATSMQNIEKGLNRIEEGLKSLM